LLLGALDTKPNELSLNLCETHLFAMVWTEESVALCESEVGTLSKRLLLQLQLLFQRHHLPKYAHKLV